MSWLLARQLILDDISKRAIGAELDSDAGFAKRAKCSVPTVKRAMADLARLGYVIRRKGLKTRSWGRPVLVSGSDFSFSRSVELLGSKLITRLIEKSRRSPNRLSSRDVERRAHSILGLKRNEPFFVIARLRIIDGRPLVIHRSYLNPSYFPATFLADHDFRDESLLDILEEYRMRVRSRETRIRAVLPTDEEWEMLSIGKEPKEPVLDIEQSLYALSQSTGELIIAEYMHATYAHWEYLISDRGRGAPTQSKQ